MNFYIDIEGHIEDPSLQKALEELGFHTEKLDVLGVYEAHQFRIKNKGVKSLRSNFTGDLYCRVHVETPINITKEQEELLRQLDNSFRTSKSTHIPKENRWVDKIKEFFE